MARFRASALGQAHVAQRQLHLFQRGKRREQIEALEHEAGVLQAEMLQFAHAQAAEFMPQRTHTARIGRLQAAENRQQGAFAAAGRAGNQRQFASVHVQREIVQHRALDAAGHERLAVRCGLQRQSWQDV